MRSVCAYCGVGCGLRVAPDGRGGVTLAGDAEHPGNQGALCSKGRSLHHTVSGGEGRLLYPEQRQETGWLRADWDTAMTSISARLQDIIAAYGTDSVYLYGSGQLLTEDYYVMTKLVKGFLGTNNLDTNSRLCMSSAVVAQAQSFGTDCVPCCYEDLDHCQTIFVIGANPAWAHPVLWQRIVARKQRGEAVQVIVADPRTTDTASIADIHLRLRPGSDQALCFGLARALRERGAWDRQYLSDHVIGLSDLETAIEPWTLEATAAACGLDIAAIDSAAAAMASGSFVSCWTMGLNQQVAGVAAGRAVINLHLLTGAIGKLGSGPFSLTGQPNAMGGRETGGMANLLPGHRRLGDAAERAAVADFWGVPELSPRPGPTAVELIEAIEAKRIRAVWVLATNPLASQPDLERVHRAFASLDCLIVQDAFPTETAAIAHWRLPASTWPEKCGTMTSSERRIALLEAVLPAPGEARDDWRILADLAQRLGFGAAFAWPDAAAVFAEWAALSAGRDCDCSGVSHERLRHEGPLQWPVPSATHPGTARLFGDGGFAFPDRRARLFAAPVTDCGEAVSSEHPFVLTTGRLRDQWHYQTRSGRVSRLRDHAPEPAAELHPQDATALGVIDGDPLRLSNRRGSVVVKAVLSSGIRPGTVAVPMHWGPSNAGWSAAINRLTSSRLDPDSKQPELKRAAVAVHRHQSSAGRVVVVGGGAVAQGLLEAWSLAGVDGELSIVAAEPEGLYDRVMLPHVIDGSRAWSEILRYDPAAVMAAGATWISARAEAIERSARLLHLSDGRSLAYDCLILATGSRARSILPGPRKLTGCFTLRQRQDAEALAALARPGVCAVVVGAGLLGLEVADALLRRGAMVRVIVRGDRLMGRQLDARASALLSTALQSRGLRFEFGRQVTEVLGEQGVRAVRLDDGRECPADLVLTATGTEAQCELARNAGLAVARGVVVDEQLSTSDPTILAAGECAEFAGQSCGTTAAAKAMAALIVDRLAGKTWRRWQGWIDANLLKIEGLQLASIGVTEAGDGAGWEHIVLDDGCAGYYQKRVLRHGRMVGAICLGDVSEFVSCCDLVRDGTELDDLRSGLLRPGSSPAVAVVGRLICSCHRVGESTLRRMAGHCSNLDELCRRSRAGTGCGSCRPEVAQIYASSTNPAA